MKLSIGAIVLDEFDYLLEWLAWYLQAGFDRFYLADNGSSDGTLQFLEALEQAKIAKVWYEPRREKAQLYAYNGMLEKWGPEIDGIAFVDADEFIVHENGLPVTPYLQQLMSKPNIGAVGINWRIFGSGGHLKQEQGLVIERFQKCAAESEWRGNRHIKSVVKPEAVEYMYCHHAELHPHYDYVDSNGTNLRFCDWHLQPIETASPYSLNVNLNPLRINHYVIKSLQEFTEKKRRRGSAVTGPNHDKGHELFIRCDKNELHYPYAAALAPLIKGRITELEDTLKQTSDFYLAINGDIEICTNERISGWLQSEGQNQKEIAVNIFVNGLHKAKVFSEPAQQPQIDRPGTYSNFTYLFEPPLNIGDTVEVKVYANRYQFPTDKFFIS